MTVAARRDLVPLGSCLLAALLFGASTPASKHLLSDLSPLAVAGLLYLGAAVAVLPAALRRVEGRRTGRNLARLGGAVFFGGLIGPVLMLFGLRSAPAGDVSLWLILETPATAILGVCFFGEHATRRLALAVVMIVFGGALLAAPFDLGSARAFLLVAGACVCWGLDNQLTATIDGFTPSQTTLAKGLVAGSTNLALAFLFGVAPAFDATCLAALGVGAIGYGASLVLYIAGAQQLGATRSQILFSTAPLFGLGIAWGALGERVEPAQIAAAAVMFGAIAILRREPHGHRHLHSAVRHTHWHRHDDGHHDHHHPELPGRPRWLWHDHPHEHEAMEHEHEHRPDIHHHHEH